MHLLGEGALISVIQCLSLHRSYVRAKVSAAAKDGILCSGFPQRLRDGLRTCLVNLRGTGMAELLSRGGKVEGFCDGS